MNLGPQRTDDCKFCRVIASWQSGIGIQRSYYNSRDAPALLHSLPFPREIGAPESPEADKIRSVFLGLDLAEHFVGMKDFYLYNATCGPGLDSESVLARLRYLFQKFIALERNGCVEVHYWGVPDVEEEIRRAMEKYPCKARRSAG